MSEKGPKTSVDTAPEKKGVDVFGVTSFDEMREKQRQLVIAALDDVDRYNRDEVKKAKDEVYATFDDRVKNYLLAEGAITDEDDPTLKAKRAYIRRYSIDNMSEDDWLYDEVEGGAVKKRSGRNVVKEDFARIKAEADADEPEPAPEGDKEEPENKEEDKEDEKEEKDSDTEKKKERKEKIEALEKEIEKLRGVKHATFAKRMAVSVFRFKKKKTAQEEYEDSEAVYLKKVAELEQLKMDIDTEEHYESYTRDEDVKKLLAERFAERLKKDDDLQHEAMLKEGGFKARLLEKWANMSKKKKIAAAVGLGAVTAVGGFSVALLGGVVGTVGGLLLAGGWTGAKGARTRAMAYSRIYKRKDPNTLKVTFSNESIEPSHALKEAIARLRGEAKKDIESGDKVKRNAVFLAVGGAALGSTAALGLSHGLDWVTNRSSGWAGGATGDLIAGPEVTPTSQWTLPHGIEDVAAKPEVTPTDFNIRPGAGWYEEFSKLPGIPKEHYHELLQKVGPQLHEIKDSAGHPIAYEMHGHPGEWGVRMTPDGKMPEEAFQKIQDAYNEMQGNNVGSVTHEAASQATNPVDVDHVNLTNTDVNDLSNVIHMETITPEAVEAHQSLLDKIGYTANGVSAEKLADRIGIPDQVWLDNLKPFLVDHVKDHIRIDGYDYSNYFSVQNDDVVFATNNKLPSAIVADILRQVPEHVRESATIS